MDKNNILEEIQGSMEDTMMSALGIEITGSKDNCVYGKMPVDKRTVQNFGILHGGASAALAESLGSIAGTMQIDPDKEVVMGIEINVNYLKAVQEGWVYGKAAPIKIEKRIQVWEIQITDKDKKLVCISRLTLAVIKKR